jgi:hypothetical protein
LTNHQPTNQATNQPTNQPTNQAKMFSDVVFDSLFNILDNLKPDYAYKQVYPRDIVIGMIASMLLTQAISERRGQTLESIRRITMEEAIALYDEKMRVSKSVLSPAPNHTYNQ